VCEGFGQSKGSPLTPQAAPLRPETRYVHGDGSVNESRATAGGYRLINVFSNVSDMAEIIRKYMNARVATATHNCRCQQLYRT
jgi:hypothetical protein